MSSQQLCCRFRKLSSICIRQLALLVTIFLLFIYKLFNSDSKKPPLYIYKKAREYPQVNTNIIP